MQQTLTFYEAILAHDHPAYLGILRLSLHSAKGGTDIALLRLYIVSLTILPMNILIGQYCYDPRDSRKADSDLGNQECSLRTQKSLKMVLVTIIFLRMDPSQGTLYST